MRFKQTVFKIIFSITLFGWPNITLARWATPNDAIVEIEKITRDIYVKKDGTYTKTKTIKTKLLKDSAKSIFSHLPIQYNSDINTIKILEAKTVLNGKEYFVSTDQIEDKPVASNINSFDQKNQIIIAYPHLEANATTHLKYITKNTKAPIEYFYSDVFDFGLSYTTSDLVTITSEIPLYIETQDPNNALSINQYTKKEKQAILYITEIKQKKPLYTAIINEETVRLNPKNYTLVAVSSEKEWKQIGKALTSDYNKIKQQKLPELYKDIVNSAKTKKNIIDQINTVTTLLSNKITFLSDMRTTHGRIIPQSLQKVADTRLGDCKDFSMATSVILQSLGIPSKIALVMRGDDAFAWPLTLPSWSHFNHAIVRVNLPHKTLWIDPTNTSSMANNTWPDIANRSAFVLDDNQIIHDTIPEIKPNAQQAIKKEIWDMSDPMQTRIQGDLQFLGSYARIYAGTMNQVSPETIKSHFINALTLNQYGQIADHDVILPDLNSKIVQDQKFFYNINARNIAFKTNSGSTIPIHFKKVDELIARTDTVSDICLGAPYTIEYYTTIKNIIPIGSESLNCHIQSPWADVTRTVKHEKDQTLIHQRIELKKRWITGTELQSSAYKKLQLGINQNFNGASIHFQYK